jgi:MarR family transcriptional regulator, 2-MHQ and catechol-resistance regulon repressor
MTARREPEQLAAGIERLFLLLARLRGRLGEPEPLPLTMTQKLALATVVDFGPVRIRALGERMETTEATASRTVDGLVRVGLARRRPDPDDRRGVRIEATAAGRRLVEQRRAHMVGLLEELLAGMDVDEQARLVALLGSLNDALDRSGAGRETAGIA